MKVTNSEPASGNNVHHPCEESFVFLVCTRSVFALGLWELCSLGFVGLTSLGFVLSVRAMQPIVCGYFDCNEPSQQPSPMRQFGFIVQRPWRLHRLSGSAGRWFSGKDKHGSREFGLGDTADSLWPVASWIARHPANNHHQCDNLVSLCKGLASAPGLRKLWAMVF